MAEPRSAPLASSESSDPEVETGALPAEPFAKAKAELSGLMTEALRHRPFLLDRHNGRERALVISMEDLGTLLESFEFQPKVSVSDGEFVVRLPEFNLIAGGSTYDEAVEELAELAFAHAQDFLARLEFFVHTDRRRELPWALRIAITPTDELPGILSSDPPRESGQASEPA